MRYHIKTGIMVLVFCGIGFSAEKLVAQEVPMTAKEYVELYKEIAMQEMRVYKIPASITLAQGLLESSSGNSKLAKECNNHFGIKCKKGWTGKFCLENDDADNECFRGYETAEQSYRDHSEFLRVNSRYGFLFTLDITDYKGWSHGLRTAGYATNPAYGSILIGVIERHRLTQYDSMVLLGDEYVGLDTNVGKVFKHNGIEATKANAGDTPETIANKYQMGSWQIYKYNDLPKGADLNPGEIVYLKPKKRKGSVEVVKVKEGDDLRSLSQQYGIKLKHLYKKNRIKPGQMVVEGEVLYLRSKRSEVPELESKEMEEERKEKKEDAFHVVQQGETLYGIGKKYGVSVDSMMSWNGLLDGGIKEGQVLRVRERREEEKEIIEEREVKKEKEEGSYHLVQKGETLYGIGKKYGKSVSELQKLNSGLGVSIREGQRIRVQ